MYGHYPAQRPFYMRVIEFGNGDDDGARWGDASEAEMEAMHNRITRDLKRLGVGGIEKNCAAAGVDADVFTETMIENFVRKSNLPESVVFYDTVLGGLSEVVIAGFWLGLTAAGGG